MDKMSIPPNPQVKRSPINKDMDKKLEELYAYLNSGMGATEYDFKFHVKQIISQTIEEAVREERENFRKWAKEHNQCSDLVSTYDLLRFIDHLQAPDVSQEEEEGK